jgi:hypothetical protein
MGQVIHVNFKHRCRTELRADRLYQGFIELLQRKGLVEDDIQEVLDGIRDQQHYDTLDADLKRIVDIWHANTGHLT